MSQNKTREIEVTDSIVDTIVDKFVTRAKFGKNKSPALVSKNCNLSKKDKIIKKIIGKKIFFKFKKFLNLCFTIVIFKNKIIN
jgi:hypothetical protein